MKQYKRAASPAKSPDQSQPTQKPVDKQQIDAAIQYLSQYIENDPKKAAKIFETWLDAKGQTKKNVQKKTAA